MRVQVTCLLCIPDAQLQVSVWFAFVHAMRYFLASHGCWWGLHTPKPIDNCDLWSVGDVLLEARKETQ